MFSTWIVVVKCTRTLANLTASSLPTVFPTVLSYEIQHYGQALNIVKLPIFDLMLYIETTQKFFIICNCKV